MRKRRIVWAIGAFCVAALMFSLASWLFFFNNAFSLFYIRGDSMEPTLKDGESVVLRQADTVEKGQFIFFRRPSTWNYASSNIIVKRIAAVPGDVLSYSDRKFSVNGKVVSTLPESYPCHSAPESYSFKLTPYQIFVLGDNPNNSMDSRKAFCEGKPNNMFVPKARVIDFGEIVKKF